MTTKTTNPEALRLADWCDSNSSGIYRNSSLAASELRRLQARVDLLDALIPICKQLAHEYGCGGYFVDEDLVDLANKTIAEIENKSADALKNLEVRRSVQRDTHRIEAALHPDDAAVDALAGQMKAKLAKQRAKGCGGWDNDCTQQRLSEMLRAHVAKGDPVDVANFCAFLSARGEGITSMTSHETALYETTEGNVAAILEAALK